jgi:hypothetical protein
VPDPASALARMYDTIAEMFVLEGPKAFALSGVRYVADTPATVRNELADALYEQFHCRIDTAEARPLPVEAGQLSVRDFARNLADANTGTGSWQHGWLYRGDDEDGRVIAESMGVRFWCAPNEVRGVDDTTAPGSGIEVRIPSEYRELVPGFFMITGDADDDMDRAATVRIYWNVTATGAALLVRELSLVLNRAEIPFRFKTQADPSHFSRADAGVLYLRCALFERTAPLVASVARKLAPYLNPDTSALVKQVAPGLGIAEDPGDGSSFGQHRCRIIAEVVLSPSFAGAATVAARRAALLSGLRAARLDPDALHLNPGSTTDYAWPSESEKGS